MATRTAARRPIAKRPATPLPKKKLAPSPEPAARKAAPVSDAKKEQLAAARAAKTSRTTTVKEDATKGVEVHPTRKPRISEHDVLRAKYTYETLYQQWVEQEQNELGDAVAYVAPMMGTRVGVPKKSPQTRAKVEPDERVIDEYYDRDAIERYSLKELRELAADLVANDVPGMTETKLKTKILAQMEAAGLFREDGSADADEDDVEGDVDEDATEDVDGDDDEEESEDDSDGDDDDGEEVVYDRADLKAMNLKDLQDLAEANEKSWKGLGKSALIDVLLADDDEEGEEAEEEETDEEDEEVVGIDPDELPNMDLDELLDLCKQIELKVPVAKRKNKKAVIQLILDELGDEEEDDE